MIRRYAGIYFLFAGFTLSTYRSFSQDSAWPPKEWKDSLYTVRTKGGWASTRNLFGNLVMKNGDTLLNCYLRPWKDYCYILTLNQVHPVQIQYRDVFFFQAIAPAPENSPVEFRPLYKNSWLWRLIRRKGNVSIYDLSENLHLNNFGTLMVLMENEKIIKIYGNLMWPTPTNRNQLLLKFINNRYHQSFKKEDFKTGMEMIDYILDEEVGGISRILIKKENRQNGSAVFQQ